ncbi:MAG: OsmC family protein [Candidatus Hodarchaeota archaeon]
MTKYRTKTVWLGGHKGELICSNGATILFSSPEALHGERGLLTPEDAFVGALNSCFMLMFIWAIERLRINLMSYESEAVGHVKERLDKTSIFNRVLINPKIVAKNCCEKDIEKALRLAEKYSLIWQSIKADVKLQPEIIIHTPI